VPSSNSIFPIGLDKFKSDSKSDGNIIFAEDINRRFDAVNKLESYTVNRRIRQVGLNILYSATLEVDLNSITSPTVVQVADAAFQGFSKSWGGSNPGHYGTATHGKWYPAGWNDADLVNRFLVLKYPTSQWYSFFTGYYASPHPNASILNNLHREWGWCCLGGDSDGKWQNGSMVPPPPLPGDVWNPRAVRGRWLDIDANSGTERVFQRFSVSSSDVRYTIHFVVYGKNKKATVKVRFLRDGGSGLYTSVNAAGATVTDDNLSLVAVNTVDPYLGSSIAELSYQFESSEDRPQHKFVTVNVPSTATFMDLEFTNGNGLKFTNVFIHKGFTLQEDSKTYNGNGVAFTLPVDSGIFSSNQPAKSGNAVFAQAYSLGTDQDEKINTSVWWPASSENGLLYISDPASLRSSKYRVHLMVMGT
jgi:hypothetical protein